MDTSRAYHSLCSGENRYIYATGSSIEKRQSGRKAEVYDIETEQWRGLADMQEIRAYHGSCTIGRYLYVFGGRNSSGGIQSIERVEVTQSASRWHSFQIEGMEPIYGLQAKVMSSSEVVLVGGFCPIKADFGIKCIDMEQKKTSCAGLEHTEMIWTAYFPCHKVNQHTLITVDYSSRNVFEYNHSSKSFKIVSELPIQSEHTDSDD